MKRLISQTRLAFVVAVLAPLAVFAAPTNSGAAPELPASTLGMRASGGFPDPARVDQYERLLGQPLQWYVVFGDRESPSKMRSSVQGQVKPGSVLGERSGQINVVMTMPLAFGKGDARTATGREAIRRKLQETANGQWDADFRAAAQALVAGGHPNAVLRLGHEFTGAWYPWSAQGNAPSYIAAYRRVHDVMSSVSPKFRFEWNSARNTFGQYGPDAYPGDAYVDIVSIDVYYEPWKGDPAPLTDDVWQRRYTNVMEKHRDFARQRGKQVAYTEWANGLVDRPEFIERMHGWFTSLPASGGGSLAYHSYFNASNDKYNLDKYPKSKAAYIRLFGGGDGVIAPPTTTPPTTTPPTTTPLTATPTTTTTPPSTGSGPKVSVRNDSAPEGTNLVIRFVLDRAATSPVTVQFDITGLTADNDDFRAPANTEVVIPKGAVRAFLGIPTVKDTVREGPETLRIRITSAAGATIDVATATATITDL